jgi:hypothetical protein
MFKRRTGFNVPFKGPGAAGTANQAATTIVAANTVKPAADREDTATAEDGPDKENHAPVSVHMPVFKKPKLFQAPAAAAGAQQQDRQAAPQQQAPPADTPAGDAITFAVLYTKRAKFSVRGVMLDEFHAQNQTWQMHVQHMSSCSRAHATQAALLIVK